MVKKVVGGWLGKQFRGKGGGVNLILRIALGVILNKTKSKCAYFFKSYHSWFARGKCKEGGRSLPWPGTRAQD
jgi:hypothetical protein